MWEVPWSDSVDGRGNEGENDLIFLSETNDFIGDREEKKEEEQKTYINHLCWQ